MDNFETNKKSSTVKRFLSLIGSDKLVLIAAIIIVFALFTAINPNYFTWNNIVNILVASSLIGMVAVGHTYLIIAGQNDLSPGSLAALSGVLMALLLSWNVPALLAVVITMTVGASVGVFNAWMVNKIKLEAFIATLVTQAVVRGFAYIICDCKPVSISSQAFIRLGKARVCTIPVSVWLMLIAMVLFGFILSKTKFGRSVYAIGGSAEAARLAGLNPQRMITVCFVLIGVLTSVGGIVFASRMNAGQPAANIVFLSDLQYN